MIENSWCKSLEKLVVLLISTSERTEFRIISFLIEIISLKMKQFVVYMRKMNAVMFDTNITSSSAMCTTKEIVEEMLLVSFIVMFEV